MHTERGLARSQWFALISFALPLVLLALFGFPPTSKAASKDDLIEGAKKEGLVARSDSTQEQAAANELPRSKLRGSSLDFVTFRRSGGADYRGRAKVLSYFDRSLCQQGFDGPYPTRGIISTPLGRYLPRSPTHST
ncbi:MAG: hypothetical protein HY694_18145 [Deltaproteobacteria bacterium]|nr:hypothetical protein [Deltaproteobacteria bacterium]